MYTFSDASSLYFHLSDENEATTFGCILIVLSKLPMFLKAIIFIIFYDN